MRVSAWRQHLATNAMATLRATGTVGATDAADATDAIGTAGATQPHSRPGIEMGRTAPRLHDDQISHDRHEAKDATESCGQQHQKRITTASCDQQ